jgi:hypothetical protein
VSNAQAILAVSRVTELQSHYLFKDRFGRPGKGNDKIPWGLPPAMLPVLARSAIEELIMEANVYALQLGWLERS